MSRYYGKNTRVNILVNSIRLWGLNKTSPLFDLIFRHCQETKVLGLNCQYNGKTVTLLQLATYPGLCVLIQLNRIKKIPMEFQVGYEIRLFSKLNYMFQFFFFLLLGHSE